MAISSFNNGVNSIRIIASDAGQDFKIGSDQDALKVAGTFLFEEDSIQTFPRIDHQAFLNLTVCLYKSIIKELKIINQHLECVTDLNDMEVEPGNDEGAI